MTSSDNLFEDIEQDNNPSFYGNQSILNDPYGKNGNNVNSFDHSGGNGHSFGGSYVHSSYGNGSSFDQSSSVLHSPTHPSLPSPNGGVSTDLVNSQIGLSNQIHKLINDPDLKVDVVSSERLVNSSVIVYSIQLAVFDKSSPTGSTNSSVSEDKKKPLISIIVKRRYSEFKSIRDNLIKLYPTSIIPPIPEKHSIFTFLANSINNSNEINIIEMRKRSFKSFLIDLIFHSNPELKNCVLLHKFLDPNYELCWYNAILEPPVNLLPNSLLLANPLNPTDQNGLYSLLPMVHGFDSNSTVDNLSSLRKFNEDLKVLSDQIALFELKGNDYAEMKKKAQGALRKQKNKKNANVDEDDNGAIDHTDDLNDLNGHSENTDLTDNDDDFDSTLISHEYEQFKEIPKNLIQFEIKFHHVIKILNDLNKLNARNTKNYKMVVGTLIELGGNLNNFSLQIYESASIQTSQNSPHKDNSLSLSIEKFGSTIDSNFLNFEGFVAESLIPEWQEPIHQLIQYYTTSLSLIKFYKYKIIQIKLLYKLRFNKLQELLNITSTSASVPVDYNNGTTNGPNLDHLKTLNSPSINKAIQRMESSRKRSGGLKNKKSWYGLFGGNNSYNKSYSNSLVQGDELSVNQFSNQLKFKVSQIENELNKLNQLIELTNGDMIKLTAELSSTYKNFLVELERKWLVLMINYIKNGKTLFNENLGNWTEFRTFLSEN